jgi:hypothetical protein
LAKTIQSKKRFFRDWQAKKMSEVIVEEGNADKEDGDDEKDGDNDHCPSSVVCNLPNLTPLEDLEETEENYIARTFYQTYLNTLYGHNVLHSLNSSTLYGHNGTSFDTSDAEQNHKNAKTLVSGSERKLKENAKSDEDMNEVA